MSTKVGMIHSVNICASIRKKGYPGEQCSYKAAAGSEWCGRHQANQIRFIGAPPTPDIIEMVAERIPTPLKVRSPEEKATASILIRKAWAKWLSRRAGPLLHAKDESNNPFDFFSSDPITEIPLRYFISFVDGGKGYCMDTRSVTALLGHAATSKEEPLNPFNRAILPSLFRARLKRHKLVEVWTPLVAVSEEQKISMAANDVFRAIEDLGYYTNPAWFLELSRQGLQRFYIELADIWFHRAGLQSADRARIAPTKPFPLPITTALVMQQRALRPLLLETCRLLVTGAAAKSDRQLGVMYIMGALSIISGDAAAANPWIYEMFSPGVTQLNGIQILVAHPAVLHY
jgi:hypothetical protein